MTKEEAMTILSCPVCASTSVSTFKETRSAVSRFGTSQSYEATVNLCRQCGEEGDFDAASDPAIKKALDEANSVGVQDKLARLESARLQRREHRANPATTYSQSATTAYWRSNADETGSRACHATDTRATDPLGRTEGGAMSDWESRRDFDATQRLAKQEAFDLMLEALLTIKPLLPHSLTTPAWGDEEWTRALSLVESAITKAQELK